MAEEKTPTGRRNERQTKVPEVRAPSGGNNRDTRIWCRGKRGVTHKPVCVDYAEHKRVLWSWAKKNEWKLLICSECNKQLDRYWPSPWRREEKPPPPWVT